MMVFSLADERRGGQRPDDDGAARKPLADIVVGVAEHLELQALHGEGAERLAGRAAQPHGDVAGRQRRPCRSVRVIVRREPRADGAVRVADVVGELHLLAAPRTAAAASFIICASRVSGTSLRPSSVQ